MFTKCSKNECGFSVESGDKEKFFALLKKVFYFNCFSTGWEKSYLNSTLLSPLSFVCFAHLGGRKIKNFLLDKRAVT